MRRRLSAVFRRPSLSTDTSPADNIVAEGHLHILHASKTVERAAKRSSWKRRYFVLLADGQLNYFKSGKAGVGKDARGGALLTSEYFVGDSLLRVHGFQISDFETTVYLAAATNAEQLDWMFKLGTVLRMLGDGSVGGWDAKARMQVGLQTAMREAKRRRDEAS